MYAKCHDSKTAKRLFNQLQYQSLEVNEEIFNSLLNTCGTLTDISVGKIIHTCILNVGIELTETLQVALLNMYIQCGFIEPALSIFTQLKQSHKHLKVDTWNIVIAATGHHGQGRQTLQLFDDMVLSGVSPNGVTFTSVLNACSHNNLVDSAFRIFNSMDSFSIPPTEQHYNCLLDLLNRAGRWKEAESLMSQMPTTSVVAWKTLLGGYCTKHRTTTQA
jgi:pentatricopeptide repeat protein